MLQFIISSTFRAKAKKSLNRCSWLGDCWLREFQRLKVLRTMLLGIILSTSGAKARVSSNPCFWLWFWWLLEPSEPEFQILGFRIPSEVTGLDRCTLLEDFTISCHGFMLSLSNSEFLNNYKTNVICNSGSSQQACLHIFTVLEYCLLLLKFCLSIQTSIQHFCIFLQKHKKNSKTK